jgi:hypothetical protein
MAATVWLRQKSRSFPPKIAFESEVQRGFSKFFLVSRDTIWLFICTRQPRHSALNRATPVISVCAHLGPRSCKDQA